MVYVPVHVPDQKYVVLTITKGAVVVLGCFEEERDGFAHAKRLEDNGYQLPTWVAKMYSALPSDTSEVLGGVALNDSRAQEILDGLMENTRHERKMNIDHIKDATSKGKVKAMLSSHGIQMTDEEIEHRNINPLI